MIAVNSSNADQNLPSMPSLRRYEDVRELIATPAEPTPLLRVKRAVLDDVTVEREADFNGVTCPLNYVKTKLLLTKMEPGQVLAVVLDEAGGRSVPQSAEKDGHKVLTVQEQAGRWRVLIRKA